MIDLYGIFERLSTWFEGHPSVVAWLIGWVAALAAAQAVKQLLPLVVSDRAARYIVQLVAISTGTLIAWSLWPLSSPHGHVFALVVGMSAPQAYTGIKAVVCWRLPGLAYRLSWDRVRDRKSAAEDSCSPHA